MEVEKNSGELSNSAFTVCQQRIQQLITKTNQFKTLRQYQRTVNAHHVGQQCTKDALMPGIDIIIGFAHGTAECAVAADEGVEGVAEHGARPTRHLCEGGDGRYGGALIDQAHRALRDVDRVIADALEVARHLDRADQETEVAGHRLLEGQHSDGLILGLYLEPVEFLVGLDHRDRLVAVALEQRFDRERD
mgnify:CR=1 FL=1